MRVSELCSSVFIVIWQNQLHVSQADTSRCDYNDSIQRGNFLPAAIIIQRSYRCVRPTRLFRRR